MKTIHKTLNQQSLTDVIRGVGTGRCLKILCPNCGSDATRRHAIHSNLIETACQNCDYFLVLCSETGNVVEAYAPGIPFN
ncbi:hypothetical protein Lepto7376_0939 [[Leptolyngbya] sp. PCC 7376]|nr:hypothetical protein Lepto7376_0939 [[Leptolyngbya] sp. PCC 7376]